MILVEAGPEPSMFKPKLREYATKALTDRGVEVKTGTAVALVEPIRATLSRVRPSRRTTSLGRGPAGEPLLQSVGVDLEREPDRRRAGHHSPGAFEVTSSATSRRSSIE